MKAYEHCHDDFHRYCSALSYGQLETQDLVQEVLLAAYEHFDTIRKKEQFLYYLIKIARNKSINHWHKHKYKTTLLEQHTANLKAQGLTPEKALDIQLLYQLLAQLPPIQREAVILFEMCGFKMKEIAEIQGSSVSAVKTRISRGRKRLKELMRDEDRMKGFLLFFAIPTAQAKGLQERSLDQLIGSVSSYQAPVPHTLLQRLSLQTTTKGATLNHIYSVVGEGIWIKGMVATVIVLVAVGVWMYQYDKQDLPPTTETSETASVDIGPLKKRNPMTSELPIVPVSLTLTSFHKPPAAIPLVNPATQKEISHRSGKRTYDQILHQQMKVEDKAENIEEVTLPKRSGNTFSQHNRIIRGASTGFYAHGSKDHQIPLVKNSRIPYDPFDMPDPLDPIDANDPIDVIDPNDQIDPMTSTDPLDPVNAVDLIAPVDPIAHIPEVDYCSAEGCQRPLIIYGNIMSLKRKLLRNLKKDGLITSRRAKNRISYKEVQMSVNGQPLSVALHMKYQALMESYQLMPCPHRIVEMTPEYIIVGEWREGEQGRINKFHGRVHGHFDTAEAIKVPVKPSYRGSSSGGFHEKGLQDELEERPIDEFKHLEVDGLAIVYLSRGETETAKVKVSGMPIEDLITENRGDTLLITTRKEHSELSVSGEEIKVSISAPGLKSISVRGAAELYTNDPISSDQLDVFVAEVGAAWLEVEVMTLRMYLEGGDLTIKGKAEEEFIYYGDQSARGKLDKDGLEVK